MQFRKALSLLGKILGTACTAATLAAVVWLFYWTVDSSGSFVDLGDSDYHQLLTRGFRKGHLYLDLTPPAELVALKDPYDPAQNGPYRLPDATYFRGHYYLYFGPAPAVTLMLPYAALTGRVFTTAAAVFIFCTIGFLTASAVWLAIRRRYFPQSAPWVAPLGVLALGLGSHFLVLVRRPMWWELPIAAGVAFSMLALAGVYAAIHGRRPALALGVAGLCLGLAVASRPTCLFGVPMLAVPIWLVARKFEAGREWWRLALAAAAPLGACLVALLVYNYARFGNAFEFGQNYQLTSAIETKWQHFSVRFVPHNSAVYFFQPLKWAWEFPFVAAQAIMVDLRGYFGTEQVGGVAVTFPFVWLALAAPLAAMGRDEGEARRLRAMLVAMAGFFVPVAALVLSFFSTTARYQADFLPMLGVIALCGWLAIERQAQRTSWRFVVTPLAVGAVLVTALVGVLLSFDYHGRSMSRENPEMWTKLERAAETLLTKAVFHVGLVEGPRVLKVRFVQRPTGTAETFWRATDPLASERIVIEHIGERQVRFGYARSDQMTRWGRPLTWEAGHTHTVEIQMPSLFGGPDGESRRASAFRERSCVAVWFSGGRALGAVVAPLAPGVNRGGMPGSDFSGEIRSVRSRLFRADEAMEEVHVTRGGPGGDVSGGSLRLRIVLPDKIAAAGEPLFATGTLYGSDIVFVRGSDGDAVKIVFEHYGSPQRESEPLRLVPGIEHSLEITFPSCAVGSFSGAATGEVIVRVDGAEVLRMRCTCVPFAAGSEMIGRNTFGTTCAPRFRGWLLEARWVN